MTTAPSPIDWDRAERVAVALATRRRNNGPLPPAVFRPVDLPPTEQIEDAIEADPAEEVPRDVRESGLYVHRTGDQLIDQWQEEAALGKEIDFGAAFADPESKKAFDEAKALSRARHAARHGIKTEDVHDDYTGGR